MYNCDNFAWCPDKIICKLYIASVNFIFWLIHLKNNWSSSQNKTAEKLNDVRFKQQQQTKSREKQQYSTSMTLQQVKTTRLWMD